MFLMVKVTLKKLMMKMIDLANFSVFLSLARCIIYATTEKLHCQQFLTKIIIELRITLQKEFFDQIS